MFVATVIVSVLLALVALGSAGAKLAKNPKVIESVTSVGVPENRIPILAMLEIAGAVGVIIGLWVAPLGIAAGIGLVLYFIGATVSHVRVHDNEYQPPAVLALLAAAAVVLRIVTM